MPISVQKLPDRWVALGLAAHFVARREPFAGFKAADLIRTLSAQIHRGHYLFALDKAAKDARVMGYFGWALYDTETAERFAATGIPPARELPDGGDVAWVLTVAAVNGSALRAMANAAHGLYPRHRVMGMRHKPGGKRVVFDQRQGERALRLAAEMMGLDD